MLELGGFLVVCGSFGLFGLYSLREVYLNNVAKSREIARVDLALAEANIAAQAQEAENKSSRASDSPPTHTVWFAGKAFTYDIFAEGN